jgi:hypothetical protein
MKLVTITLFCFLFISLGDAQGQSLVEDANLNLSPQGSETAFNETIKIISNSKRIFILSNNNQQLGPGDFISIAINNNLAARAVVAKTHQGNVGIKILKIYSLAYWGKLRRDMEVQIIKGDDSLFGKKTITETKQEPKTSKIKSEDDLYTGDVVVEDDVGVFDENKNRHIKPDNLVALTGAFFQAAEVESRGGTVRTQEFGVSWAYQFADNYFVEGIYGRALLNAYPREGEQTLINHLTGRIKYNIKGPLYTFFMPYVGYHTYDVRSPGAGKTTNPATNNEEINAIDNLKKSGPVFGITVLRRLVPGWFIKGDVGNDIMSLGFAIEF